MVEDELVRTGHEVQVTVKLGKVTDSDTVGRVKMGRHELTARTSHRLNLQRPEHTASCTLTPALKDTFQPNLYPGLRRWL